MGVDVFVVRKRLLFPSRLVTKSVVARRLRVMKF